MAKKTAAADFNMSETIREILTADPKLGSKEVAEAIAAKNPKAKINKNSYAVAFYTIRKKLGIGGRKRGRRVSVRNTKTNASHKFNLSTLQAAAKFLGEIGGADAALAAIKQVQAIQVK